MPAATSLLGKSLYMQALTTDALANPLGAVMSDAFEARLGAK